LGQKYGKGLAEIKILLEQSNPIDLVENIKSTGEINLKNGEYYLTRDDIFIETKAEEGFAAASDSGITVGLSLELTEDLILEGIVRDVVRSVQNMRKDAGFAVEDRIEISWDLDGQIADAVGKFSTYFRNETLTNIISEKIENADYSGSVKLNEKMFNIDLKKI
jgi:isoleucyl-tRNA synthetase